MVSHDGPQQAGYGHGHSTDDPPTGLSLVSGGADDEVITHSTAQVPITAPCSRPKPAIAVFFRSDQTLSSATNIAHSEVSNATPHGFPTTPNRLAKRNETTA